MQKLTTVFKPYTPDPRNQCVRIVKRYKFGKKRKKKYFKDWLERKNRRLKRRAEKRLKKQNELENKKSSYNEYIHSDTWKQMREVILERCQNRCEDCGKLCDVLHIHHLTYARFGKEWTTDLQALCIPCHLKPEKHPWQNKK